MAGFGNDVIDGGVGGFDFLQYGFQNIGNGVVIDFGKGIAQERTGAFTDTFTEIEGSAGTDANDLLIGGQTGAALNTNGGLGDDIIFSAGSGSFLVGGNFGSGLPSGADTFIVVQNSGSTTIADFDLAEDTLNVSGLGITQFSDLSGVLAAAGTGNTLDFGNSDTIQLQGVDVSQLNASHFDFPNVITGTNSGENLDGTAGNDFFRPLSNDFNPDDFVFGSGGFDTIDFTGVGQGFVAVDYGNTSAGPSSLVSGVDIEIHSANGRTVGIVTQGPERGRRDRCGRHPDQPAGPGTVQRRPRPLRHGRR